jgi:hypothetical protein
MLRSCLCLPMTYFTALRQHQLRQCHKPAAALLLI